MTGALTPIAGSPFAAAAPLEQILVNPAAPFVYAVDLTTAGLYSYSIAPGTGMLSSVAGGPYANVIAGDSAFDPTGKYLYTADDTSMDVYVADATTGAVVPLNGSPFASGFLYGVGSTVIDPSGRFVYGFRKQMTRSIPEGVQGYLVNATTGALTSLGIAGTENGDEFQFMVIAALP